MLRVSWVDSRFFDGKGLTTATLSVPIVRTHARVASSLRVSPPAAAESSAAHTHVYCTHKNKAPDFAENPFRQASLALEHMWQLPWPAWLDSAGDRVRRRRKRKEERTGTVLDEEEE